MPLVPVTPIIFKDLSGDPLCFFANLLKQVEGHWFELRLLPRANPHFFDLKLSNENVKFAKPHPEIYWKAMSYFGALPEETLIIEDSPTGLTSAYKSGANVLRVKNSDDYDFDKIIANCNSGKLIFEKWADKKMNGSA